MRCGLSADPVAVAQDLSFRAWWMAGDGCGGAGAVRVGSLTVDAVRNRFAQADRDGGICARRAAGGRRRCAAG